MESPRVVGFTTTRSPPASGAWMRTAFLSHALRTTSPAKFSTWRFAPGFTAKVVSTSVPRDRTAAAARTTGRLMVWGVTGSLVRAREHGGAAHEVHLTAHRVVEVVAQVRVLGIG